MATIGEYKSPVRKSFDVIDVDGELFELRGTVDGYTVVEYVEAVDPNAKTSVKDFVAICMLIISQSLGEEEHARFKEFVRNHQVPTDILMTLAADLFSWATGNPTTPPSDSSQASEDGGQNSNDSFSALSRALNVEDSSGRHALPESTG